MPKSELSSKNAIMVISIFLLTPALALMYKGFTQNTICIADEISCKETCLKVWAEIERTFMSQSAGERKCLKKCETEAYTCSQTAALSAAGAIILFTGVCCTYCLLTITVALLGDSIVQGGSSGRCRPSASEPVLTEEERRKNEDSTRASRQKCMDFVGRIWGLCCCFCLCPGMGLTGARMGCVRFGKIAGIIPKDKNRMLEEGAPKAKCRKCDIDFEVHQDWLEGTMSGIEGSPCPRCNEVILGLI